MARLKGRSFLRMLDLDRAEIELVLETGRHLKRQKQLRAFHRPCQGQTMAMIFQKPSLRTRVSFEVAMRDLGGQAIYLAPTDISLGKREKSSDIATVLGSYVDVIMARVFGHEIVEDLAQSAGVPVINGLSDLEHPCQALADFMTVLEWKGRLEGLTMAYIGDGNNVANSLMLGAALLGMNFRIATPKGFEPRQTTVDEARAVAGTQSHIEILGSPEEAARGADILYTDVWTSMGQESEKAERGQRFLGYKIDRKLLEMAAPDAMVLHCLPAHYGEEITEEVARGPKSAIWDQAENRLHAQKALLNLILA